MCEQGRNFTRQDSTIFSSVDDPQLEERIGAGMLAELREELELVEGASHPFDKDENPTRDRQDQIEQTADRSGGRRYRRKDGKVFC